jgi:hypothetical protein
VNQEIITVNHTDENGNPTGGHVIATGINIRWQNGPILDKGDQNGAFVEGVIKAAEDRILFYQQGKFACPENADALDHLHKALECLNMRTTRRTREGVEGKHELGSLEHATA